MRRFLLAAIGAVCFSGSAMAGVLKDDVNRFTGDRDIAWRSIPSGKGKFALGADARIPANGGRTMVAAWLITYGDSYRFSGCNHTHWLVDGRRADEIKTRYQSDPGSGIEYFYIEPPKELIPVIAAAKKVEFQVCGEEGQISDGDMEGLRQFMKTLSDAGAGLAGNDKP